MQLTEPSPVLVMRCLVGLGLRLHVMKFMAIPSKHIKLLRECKDFPALCTAVLLSTAKLLSVLLVRSIGCLEFDVDSPSFDLEVFYLLCRRREMNPSLLLGALLELVCLSLCGFKSLDLAAQRIGSVR